MNPRDIVHAMKQRQANQGKQRERENILISYPGHVKQGLPEKPFQPADVNTTCLPLST